MSAKDTPLVLTKSSVLYRLVRRRYAGLSGVGAALYPGRWNQMGQEAIYTSLNQSTCVLEYLVHLDKRLIPTNLVMMHIKCSQEMTLETYHSHAPAADAFQTGRFSGLGAVAVPSVVVPAEHNVVLYTGHPLTAQAFYIDTVEPFEYDTRLFLESAIREV